MELVIFGAQARAYGACKAIKTILPDKTIKCFLVTSMKDNPVELLKVPVRELDDFAREMTDEDKKNIEILIGTREDSMFDIEKILEERGFYNHIRLTSSRLAEMMKNLFIKIGKFNPLSLYLVGSKTADINIYKMTHYLDKQLESDISDSHYTKKVQVGAGISDRIVADFYDDEGDNISDKNKNYSELTGLYWVWKNKVINNKLDNKYFGLSHYRRYLCLSEDDRKRFISNDIDVVLPYPLTYYPNINVHHKTYLQDDEWNAVIQALDELQPEYKEALNDILSQEYMYNFNIMLAKAEVFNNYCNWLFSILFRVEEINDPDNIKKPNRYMGYISETLLTLYFLYNKDRLRIAHTECRFLI